ncbi:hypothetical protein Y900_024875 [Mycolicibacterium aromaticivorans JS19b1 = JCM 16368]|uniref:Uncharacterized protein n=1 Tax=Mycolicibacterium aromaticivorans JS19b1 = JCM 16368 TaxID=1440774 RepID=A0A064CTM6_9MYCO|nr:hypothetical protein Y900_024875 [Mycolicibacterium aromaticivorans JS19b1 = JCM 16368]
MSVAVIRTSFSWPTASPRTSRRELNSVTVSVTSPPSRRTVIVRPTTSRLTVMNSVRYAIAAPVLTGKVAADDQTEDSRPSERAIGLPILLGRHGAAQHRQS